MTNIFSWSEPGCGSVSLSSAEHGVRLQVHAVDPRFGVVSVTLPTEQLKPLEEALRQHRIKTAAAAKAAKEGT